MRGLTMHLARSSAPLLLLVLAIGVCTPACNGRDERVVQYCADFCDCEDCASHKQEECEIERQARIDVAEAYDCGAQYSAYLDCLVDEASCDDSTNDAVFTVTCDAKGCPCDSKNEKYKKCVEKADKMKTDHVLDD